MPPRRKSAPAGRVYASATPLQQTRLPAPKKRIKSYGKQTARRRTRDEDNTLTQIGFVQLKHDGTEDEEDGGNAKQELAMEDESDYEVASKKRRTKRRKTAGDRPTSTTDFHTQTITQMDWSFSTNEPEDAMEVPTEAEEEATDVEEEPAVEAVHARSIYDVPNSSQPIHVPVNIKKLKGPARPSPRRSQRTNNADKKEQEKSIARTMRQEKPSIEMSTPQTPRKFTRQEIPSSQSPASPFSPPSRKSIRRSPLKETSINAPIPFDTDKKLRDVSEKPPKLIIEDTFESGNDITQQLNEVPPSPEKRRSPARGVRFALLEEVEDVTIPSSPPIKKEATSYSVRKEDGKVVKFEILDSDEEDDDDLEPERLTGSTPRHEKEEEDEDEICYGDIGHETQMAAENIVSSLADLPSRKIRIIEDQEAEEEGEEDSRPAVTGETQIGETQRLSTQHVSLMQPRTDRSDIFISIHPQHVTNIANRTKNHEFRNWTIPDTVNRVWIYETKPVCTLKYMAEISNAKCPGDIHDPNGLGNADFNAKLRGSTHRAYEILQLYELGDPVTLPQIIINGWMKAAPQKFAWVRPAVADELVSNLKPPLFDDDESRPSSSITDTQEAGEQLLSTIKQFTQSSSRVEPTGSSSLGPKMGLMKPPSLAVHHESPMEPDCPLGSSQAVVPNDATLQASSLPHPSQATTVDLTQAPSVRLASLELDEEEFVNVKEEDVEDIVAEPGAEEEAEHDLVLESPTRPVLPSSPPQKLPGPRSSRPEQHVQDSFLPYSMSSSQFLSRSQLLPESLLGEDVPGPPNIVHDSDSEEEDDEL